MSLPVLEREVRMLKKSLGSGVIALLKGFGVQIPESRAELGTFVSGLVSGLVDGQVR